MIKSWLRKEISDKFPDIEFDILTPPDDKMGDYSINLAFVLAKKEKISPMDAGKNLVGEFSGDKNFGKKFSKIQLVPPGFINFYLSEEYLRDQLAEISKDNEYGSSKEGKGKKIIVEYSSPNIAKPMHVGHLRSTIIGDALANVYENLGYEVIRWNYIGDWGTAIGKLIVSYNDLVTRLGKEEAWEQFFGSDTTLGMVGNYVKYHEVYQDDDKAREEFKKLENGDTENVELWKKIRKISLQELGMSVYPSIGVDSKKMKFKGESDYESVLTPIVDDLTKKGITKESEGALIIELENLPPALLRKSDGATLYITRDIASLEDRIKSYNPEKILYVVANQQTLHFEQLFAVAHKLKLDTAELVHVKFGMVLGEDGKKLATREGKVVPLLDVIKEIQVKAYGLVKHVKFANKELSNDEANNIARTVGIAALKYNDLRQHPYSDITFDWDAMLDLRGNSGPYIQYTYARLVNILNKTEKGGGGDLTTLTEPTTMVLMRKLLDFPDIIVECTKFYTLNALSLYLYELAHSANQFYEQVHVLNDENISRHDARLVLIQTVAAVLKRGLNLLGIEVLERI